MPINVKVKQNSFVAYKDLKRYDVFRYNDQTFMKIEATTNFTLLGGFCDLRLHDFKVFHSYEHDTEVELIKSDATITVEL